MDGLRDALRRGGLAIVVSDFIAPIETWSGALTRLGRRSEIIAVEVLDPRELRLPDVGLLVIEDPETGRQRTIDTADARFRARLAEVADRRRAATSAAIQRAGAMPSSRRRRCTRRRLRDSGLITTRSPDVDARLEEPVDEARLRWDPDEAGEDAPHREQDERDRQDGAHGLSSPFHAHQDCGTCLAATARVPSSWERKK